MSFSLPVDPAKSFVEHVDANIAVLLAKAAAGSIDPGKIELTANVTMRSDEEVELVRERAIAAGLGMAILVDDHVPARPGTVPSSSLTPIQAATMAEARAARILAEH